MKKIRLFILMGLLMSSFSAFGLDKTILSYEPLVFVMDMTNGSETSADVGTSYLGFHSGLIWDKVSVNIGIKGMFTDVELDVGYNIFNNDNFVWSIGGRFALDSYAIPGFGPSTNIDGLIPITEKVHLDLGLGLALDWYPTISSLLGYPDYTTFGLEITPRIGVSIKQ